MLKIRWLCFFCEYRNVCNVNWHILSFSIIKPPLAVVHRCCPSVRLSVCMFVCLSVAKIQKRDFLKK